MTAISLLQGLVLGFSYGALAWGQVPGLRMNRATIALVGATGLILAGALTLEAAWATIDPQTIVFLLSMMVVNAYLSYGGFFEGVLVYLLRLTRSPFGLLTLLTLGTGVLSALFLNDTLALVSTPLTLQVTGRLKLNPIPYLLAIAAATNIGSLATLSGNPQNILVGSFSGISYGAFLQALGPPAIAGLGIQLALLWCFYPEVRSLQPCPLGPSPRFRLHRPLLRKTLLVTAGLLTAFALGLPLGPSALGAAALLLLTRRIKAQRVLAQVDWSLLVLFCGLFVLTEGVRQLGGVALLVPGVAHPLGLMAVTTVASNVISNVPTVLLLQGAIADTPQHWLLLAASATLAGNLTLFGAIANLITAEAAAQAGYPLSFGQHFRFGLPLTLLTLALTYGWLHWAAPV